MKKLIIAIIIITIAIIYGAQVKAETINTTSKTYRVRLYFPDEQSTTWSSDINMGTSTTTDSGEGIPDAFRANFTYSSNFTKNQNYIANIQIATTNPTIGTATMRSVACRGAGDESNIKTCNLVDMQVNSGGYTTYRILFVPKVNVTTIDLRLYTTDKIQYSTVNVKSQSYVETVESEADIINNQTDILVTNNNQNTQEIINNNNLNADKVIENTNKLLGERCENLYNGTYHTGTDNKIALDLSNLETGKTYTISTNNIVHVYKFSETGSNASGTIVGPELWSGAGVTSWTFTYQGHKYLFLNITDTSTNFVTNSNQIANYNFMVIEGSNQKVYCEYGTYSSKIDKTNDILNQPHTYTNNASENLDDNGIGEYGEKEEEIMESISLDVSDMEITINPNASSFIWGIVNNLRAISAKIVLLFTGVLSLGIIKMVLNR